jgi:MFS family permease
VIYLPLWVQGVLGGTPTQAGSTVAPMLIGWPLASTLSGRLLPRTGYRPLVRTGFALVTAASVLMAALLHRGATMTGLGATMFAMGAGMGLANTALIIAVQESAAWEERGVATASTMFFRTIGGAVAVGALGAILAAGLGDGVPPGVLHGLLGPEHGRGLDPALLAQVSGQLQSSLRRVFDVIAAVSCGAIAVAFAFPDRQLAPRREAAVEASVGE